MRRQGPKGFCYLAACARRLTVKAIFLFTHAKKGEVYVCGKDCYARYNGGEAVRG